MTIYVWTIRSWGEPSRLVSSDFRGSAASSIVVVLDGKMAKVLAWYDNERGYSCRVGDLATLIAEQGF